MKFSNIVKLIYKLIKNSIEKNKQIKQLKLEKEILQNDNRILKNCLSEYEVKCIKLKEEIKDFLIWKDKVHNCINK